MQIEMSEENLKEGLSPKEEVEKNAEDKHSAHRKEKKKTEKKDEELIQIKEKLAEINDKFLRLYSEFDNYRKRTIKEKGELVKTASEEVISSLLPVLDDMERAIAALEAAHKEADSSYLEGMKLIYNKLKLTLQQKGLEAMESKGEPFDVDFHDALSKIPAPSDDLKGKVVDEIQKGYLLNGKVIRFARVVVGE
jgi:molecular chaperone GrpE